MEPTLSRCCVICTSQGRPILCAGCSIENVSGMNTARTCKLIVAVKRLAPDETFIFVELEDVWAIAVEHQDFMVIILIHKAFQLKRHEILLEAFQIAHYVELFYLEDIRQIASREAAILASKADNYSAQTEISFEDEDTRVSLSLYENFCADFRTNYLDKLLNRAPICSEWIVPLISAHGIVMCTLVTARGQLLFELSGTHSNSAESVGVLKSGTHRQMLISRLLEMMQECQEGHSKGSDDAHFEAYHWKNSINKGSSREHVQSASVMSVSLGSQCNVAAILQPLRNGPFDTALGLIVYYTNSSAISDSGDSIQYVPSPDEAHASGWKRRARDIEPLTLPWADQPNQPPPGMLESSYKIFRAAMDCIELAFPFKTSVGSAPLIGSAPTSGKSRDKVPVQIGESVAVPSHAGAGATQMPVPPSARPSRAHKSSSARRNHYRMEGSKVAMEDTGDGSAGLTISHAPDQEQGVTERMQHDALGSSVVISTSPNFLLSSFTTLDTKPLPGSMVGGGGETAEPVDAPPDPSTLHQEKLRRLEALGFVSPRKEDTAPTNSPSKPSELNDESDPYRLLPFRLEDTPRKPPREVMSKDPGQRTMPMPAEQEQPLVYAGKAFDLDNLRPPQQETEEMERDREQVDATLAIRGEQAQGDIKTAFAMEHESSGLDPAVMEPSPSPGLSKPMDGLVLS